MTFPRFSDGFSQRSICCFIGLILSGCGLFIRQPSYPVRDYEYQDLYTRSQLRDEPTLVCIPGLGANSDLFRYFTDYLDARELSWVTYDPHAHGRNEGKKGDLKQIGTHLHDLDRLINGLNTSNQKMILVGESLGAELAIWYQSQHKENIEGLVLLSPATLKRSYRAPVGLTARVGFWYLVNAAHPVHLGYDPATISSDPEFIRWANTEEQYAVHKISPRYLVQLQRLIKKNDSHLAELNAPTLILQGTDDVFTSIPAFYERMDTTKAHITAHIFPHTKHSLVNDTTRLAVFKKIVDWVDQNTGQ